MRDRAINVGWVIMKNKTEFILTLTVALSAILGAIAVSLNAIAQLFGK